jgi:Tfp pilus assembly protein PilF
MKLALLRFSLPLFCAACLVFAAIDGGVAQDNKEDAPQDKQSESADEKNSDSDDQDKDKGADENGADENKEDKKAEEKQDDRTAEEILAKATETKLNATSLNDLDAVIDLCDAAIKKGLNDASKEIANDLLEGSLFEYAKQLTSKIFDVDRPDNRWQFLRQQALKKLDRLEKMGNEWGETYILIAKLNALPNGDQKRAVEAAGKAVKYAGEDARLLSEALYIRGSLTEDEQARIADFNQAVKIDPTNEGALRQRAAYHLEKQNYEKAIDDFEMLVDLTNGDPRAYQQLTESLLASGKIEDALDVSEEALQSDDKQPMLHQLRARIFLTQADELEDSLSSGKLTKEEKAEIEEDLKQLNASALNSLDKAIELDKNDVLSLLMRAEIYLRSEQVEKSKSDVDRLLVIAPGLTRAIFLRSLIASSEGNFAAAAKDLELLAKADPDNEGYRLQLANMYSADNQHKKAIKLFSQILDEDGENLFALRGLADAYLGMGDHQSALKYFNEALARDDEDDHVLNNLAWLLATSPDDKIRDGKRSVELGLKACELTEYKQAHILSTLAAGYAETGDFENARKWSAKSVEIADKDNLEDLKKELESYKENKPWRERQESQKKENPETGGGGDFEF